jgi:hypothetical protein
MSYPSDILYPSNELYPGSDSKHGRVIVLDGNREIITDDEELMEILAHVIPAIV